MATSVSPELTSLKNVLRLAPARPALAAGLRTAVVATAPLVVAQMFDVPQATWVAVAGFLISLGDKGGAYRTRARTLGTTTLLAPIAALVAMFAATHPTLVLPITFLVITAAGLAHAYGDAVAGIGTVSAVVFVVSLASPPADVAGALSRAGLLALGGIWAMSLSLLLWAVRVYKPARRAVAAVYDEVADYASQIGGICRGGSGDGGSSDGDGGSDGDSGDEWQRLLQRGPTRIRQGIEDARRVLAGIRRGGTGERGRGERLLVLLESADRMFANLVAVADVVESVEVSERSAEEEARIAEELVDFSMGCRALAGAIHSEHGAPSSEERINPERAHVDVRYRQVERLIARLERYRATAAEVVESMNDESPATGTSRAPGTGPTGHKGDAAPLPPRMRSPLLAPIRANLSLDSLVLQHALRVGVTTTAAVAIARGFGIDHGHWIPVTCVAVLQPYMGSTVQRGIQRVFGTVFGALVAAVVAAAVHDPRFVLPLVFLFSGASVALLPLNYGLFSMLLTPAFVLLAELTSGDWSLAGVRIVNTLIGGTMALVGIRLLWPSPEHQRLPDHVRGALTAARRYLRYATSPFSEREAHPTGDLADTRRVFGLAANNAEASFQRFLAEAPADAPETEPYMTLLIYQRRLVAASIALAASRPYPGDDESDAVLREVGASAEDVLKDIAAAVADGRAPLPLPDLGARPTGDAVLDSALERMLRPVVVLHGSAERLAPSAHFDPLSERLQRSH